MVEVIPFDDHTPPKFLQIPELCAKADSWLKESLKNVIIVHCKAGKGRTGTMVSCYLMHSKRCQTPFEAMRFFEKQRTKDMRVSLNVNSFKKTNANLITIINIKN